jgi:hypothetical protein
MNTNCVVTNRGLYSGCGSLSRDVQQIGFDEMRNTSYSQSALGSAFGYGTITVDIAGGGSVANPSEIPVASSYASIRSAS